MFIAKMGELPDIELYMDQGHLIEKYLSPLITLENILVNVLDGLI